MSYQYAFHCPVCDGKDTIFNKNIEECRYCGTPLSDFVEDGSRSTQRAAGGSKREPTIIMKCNEKVFRIETQEAMQEAVEYLLYCQRVYGFVTYVIRSTLATTPEP